MIRVESHIYKKNTHNHDVFTRMTKDAKLIYNSALYRIRQRFINKHKYINDLDRYFKNADVNGAYQIMKKVTPDVYSEGVEGLVFNPVKKHIRYC